MTDRMTPTMGDVAHAELKVLANTLSRQLLDLAALVTRLAAEQADLRDELHTLANRHGWSVKAPATTDAVSRLEVPTHRTCRSDGSPL